MEKKNKIILIVTVILTICVIGLVIYSVINNKNKEESDAVKFRNEYMELNDKVSPYGSAYINVSVSENNTVEYLTEKEAVKLLEKGTGLIYFGFSGCPWCRNLVPILTDLAEELEEPVYYLDILNIRSKFELKDGKLNKISDGSENYYKILKALDKELEDYYLTDEAGNQYDTGEKRLYAPTIVAVQDGKIKGIHVGTIETQENPAEELTSKQRSEIETIITKLIKSKNEGICTKGSC